MRNGDKALDECAPTQVVLRKGFEDQATTSVAIRTTPQEDLYIVLTTWDSKSASFLIAVNPMVVWIWSGGLVVLLGTVFTLWPRPVARRVRVTEPARGGAVALW